MGVQSTSSPFPIATKAFMAREDIFLSASTKDEIQDEKEYHQAVGGGGYETNEHKNKKTFAVTVFSRILWKPEQCIMQFIREYQIYSPLLLLVTISV